MKRIRAISAWTDAHPVLSILLGMLVLWLIAVVCLPADPPYAAQAGHVVTGSVHGS